MSNTEAKKEKVPMSPEKKRMVIILSAVAAALVIAMIPIIILIVNGLKKDDAGHDIPDDVLEGTYIFNLPPSLSTITFSDGNKVVRENYYPKDNSGVSGEGDLPDGEPVKDVFEYTYEIVKEDGKHYIILTDSDGKETKELFDHGSYNRDYYRCEKEICQYNKENEGLGIPVDDKQNDPRAEGTDYCKSHADSKIYVESYSVYYITLGPDGAEDIYIKQTD